MRNWGGSRRAKGMPHQSFVVVLVLVTTLLGSVVAPASAEAPVRVKVLIAFAQPPGPSERALVRGAGGEIKYTYSLVPAIAASVPEQALNGLRRDPRVVAIEPDLQATLLDAELDNAWGVKRIGAGAVHALGNKGAGVKVAILDTGIDVDHPDLAYDPACSASFVDGESLDDGHSHGTHVAGTIAGLDDDVGVVGVAPEATLCVYKVFSNSGSSDWSDVIAALQQAVTDGVQITNNSYGSLTDPGTLVKQAFDNAHAAGLLHVAAAGNYGNYYGTGENCIYPARWDTVIATASTTQSDTRDPTSSTCPQVELAAPGSPIYSTMPGGGYGYKTGTSMASPHVAGTAALVLAAEPGWSNSEVRAQLQATADELGDPGRDPWYGYGLVDADEAAGLLNVPPSATFSYSCTGLSCDLNASGSYDPDGTIVGYAWDFGDGSTDSGVTTSHTYGAEGMYSVTLTVTDDDGATGTDNQDVSVSTPVTTLHVGDLDGVRTDVRNKWTATVTVEVHDAGEGTVSGATVRGTWSDGFTGTGLCDTDASGTCAIEMEGISTKVSSVTFTVDSVSHATLTYDPAYNHDPGGESDGTSIVVPPPAPPANQPPVAAFSYSCADLTCDFTSGSSDSDGDIVSYNWVFGDGGAGSGDTASHTYSEPGTYLVVLSVTDDDGATGTDSQNVSVTAGPPPNQPPVAAFSYTCADLTCDFDAADSSDSDGDIVSYDWVFGDGGAGSGVTTSYTYAEPGTYPVVLSVADDDGATDVESQDVSVGAGPGTMYVDEITLSAEYIRAKWVATAVVTIHDTDGSPVAGATVDGTWSGDDSGSVSGVTAADGTVALNSGKVRQAEATFTFTVDKVVHTTFTYDPGLNNETSETLVVP